jgi:hypothetical protein
MIPDVCRVEGCGRRAAVTLDQEGFPSPLRLCATHTEDFRMNASGWAISWDPVSGAPISVRAAVTPLPGRAPGPAGPAPRGERGVAAYLARAGQLVRRRRGNR